MQKILITMLLLLVACIGAKGQTPPTDTDGDGYYNISTLDHLRWVSENSSSWYWNFELDNDIDAADTKNWNGGLGWSPIGNGTTHYSGNFDGHEKTISGIYVNRPSQEYVGFFGSVVSNFIKNINLTESYVLGYHYIGGLIGFNYNYSGQITNCSVAGKIESIAWRSPEVGGLIGCNFGEVISCKTDINILGISNFNIALIGGLVGQNKGKIKYCQSKGKVNFEGYGGGGFVGGLIGQSSGDGNIIYSMASNNIKGITSNGDNTQCGGLIGSCSDDVENCYATGLIYSNSGAAGGLLGGCGYCKISQSFATGNPTSISPHQWSYTYVGGLIGECDRSIIENCYSSGDPYSHADYFVSGGGLIARLMRSQIINCFSTGFSYTSGGWYRYNGGLIGYNDNTTVSNSFWDIETSGLNYSAGGEGKTTAEMKNTTTFTNAGWDFSNIWNI